MFCVATAPTPALAQEHRAATAGEEEDMAMPNMPVSLQRATMEKVTEGPQYVVPHYGTTNLPVRLQADQLLVRSRKNSVSARLVCKDV